MFSDEELDADRARDSVIVAGAYRENENVAESAINGDLGVDAVSMH